MTTPASTYALGREWLHLMTLLEEGFDDETGEYQNDPGLDEWLEGLTEDVSEKLCGCAFVLLRMRSEADAVKDEAGRLLARVSSIQRARSRLEERVRALMAATGTDRAKSPGVSITLAKAPKRVEVTGPLPAQYMTVPVMPEPRPDLRAIGTALKAGVPVAGAELVDGKRSLRIK